MKIGMARLALVTSLFAFVSALPLACAKRTTAEEEVRNTVAEAVSKAEDKDVKGFMGFISRDYSDASGNGFDEIRGMVFFHFMRPEKLTVFVRSLDVQVKEDKALVDAKVIAVRGGGVGGGGGGGEGPRFFADAMLGSLARWLRTLGIDVEYEREIDDRDLLKRAEAESRVILTRDALLMKRRSAKGRAYFVKNGAIGGQIKEVLERFGIGAREPSLVRCLRCNARLADVGKDAVRDFVPPYVYETQDAFRRCPLCGRVYWGGTHKDQMADELKRMLG